MSIPDIRLKIVVEGDTVKASLAPATTAVKDLGNAAQATAAQMNITNNTTNNYTAGMRGASQATQELTRDVHDMREALGAIAEVEVFKKIAEGLIETKLQFMQIEYTLKTLTGSTEGAAKEMAYVTGLANYYGLSLVEVAQNYGKLMISAKAANVPMSETRDLFESLAMASTNFHLNSTQQNSVFLAIEEAMGTGTLYMRQLKLMIGEQLPGVYEEFVKMLSEKGKNVHEIVRSGGLDMKEYMGTLIQAVKGVIDPSVIEEARHGLNAELNRTATAFKEFQASLEGGIINETTLAILREATALLKGLSGSATASVVGWVVLTGAVVAFSNLIGLVITKLVAAAASIRAKYVALQQGVVVQEEATAEDAKYMELLGALTTALMQNTAAIEANNLARVQQVEANAQLLGTTEAIVVAEGEKTVAMEASTAATVEAGVAAEGAAVGMGGLEAALGTGAAILGGWPALLIAAGAALLIFGANSQSAGDLIDKGLDDRLKKLQEEIALEEKAGQRPHQDTLTDIDTAKSQLAAAQTAFDNAKKNLADADSLGVADEGGMASSGAALVYDAAAKKLSDAKTRLGALEVAMSKVTGLDAAHKIAADALAAQGEVDKAAEADDKQATENEKKLGKHNETLELIGQQKAAALAKITNAYPQAVKDSQLSKADQDALNSSDPSRAEQLGQYQRDLESTSKRYDTEALLFNEEAQKKGAAAAREHAAALKNLEVAANGAAAKLAAINAEIDGRRGAAKDSATTSYETALAEAQKSEKDRIAQLETAKLSTAEKHAAEASITQDYLNQKAALDTLMALEHQKADQDRAVAQQQFRDKLNVDSAAVLGGSKGDQDEKKRLAMAQAYEQQEKLIDQARTLYGVQGEGSSVTARSTDELNRYNEAVRQINTTTDEQIKHIEAVDSEQGQFVKNLNQGVEQTMGKTLEDSMLGHYDKIGAAWRDMLSHMASEALAKNLTKMLMGDDAKQGESGGLFGSILNPIFGLMKSVGGGGGSRGGGGGGLGGLDLGLTGGVSGFNLGPSASNIQIPHFNADNTLAKQASPGLGNIPTISMPDIEGGNKGGLLGTTGFKDFNSIGGGLLGSMSSKGGSGSGGSSLFSGSSTGGASPNWASNAWADISNAASNIWGYLGFAGGGYTGDGGKHEPAGIVHAGEWVSTAETTSKYRPLLEAIHNDSVNPGVSMRGYASGGLVGGSGGLGTSGGQQQTVNHTHQHSVTMDMDEQTRNTTMGDVFDSYFAHNLRNG